ncbi:protein spa1-related 2 [Phtheirospermum japonicum]|uniref:Protein spa1-related 2 n=1 Tax=Phtheirospermum japonicum TaxID=374723 RepID=A0A830B4F6_9LAMI|nr:protein spa1-related 2 [Phtheirospermum japonicum]
MDDSTVDEVAGPVNATRIRNKENEFSLKSGSSSMLQLNDMVTPGADDYHNKSDHQYSDILDVKDQERIVSSEHASASPRCNDDDAGVMVKELTLRNYDGEKMTVVGSSNNRERISTRQNQWQNLYNLHRQTGHKGKGPEISSDDLFTGLLDEIQPQQNLLSKNDDKGTSDDVLHASGGIRTKILSKSGFSEFFVKNTLRDKGVIHKRQARSPNSVAPLRLTAKPVSSSSDGVSPNSVAPLRLTAEPVSLSSDGVSEPLNTLTSKNTRDGVNLREWLENGGKKVNKVEKMQIFKQILDVVEFSHSRGVPLQDLRPSCFKLLGSCQVMYLGCSVRAAPTKNVQDQDIHWNRKDKRPIHQSDNHSAKKRKSGENTKLIQRWPQFPPRSGIRSASLSIASVQSADKLDEENNPKADIKSHIKLFGHNVPNAAQALQASSNFFMLEEKWYTSPELVDEKGFTFASNIYCLGVLLFELLGSFDSPRSHAAAMHDLRHRILPPRFLSENPKEAGFCLWLLHPEPSLRPSTREILQSEFMSGIGEIHGGEELSSIEEEDGESELLMHFLFSLNEQKQKDASNLVEQLQCIEADIQEIEKRHPKKSVVLSGSSSETETRLMCNISQLENAYFSMRSNIQLSDNDVATHRDEELLKSRENWCTMENEYDSSDRLGGFFDGLCKYARYNKFKVRGVLRNGEFNSSANVICSLSFDRDEDYLATGGVSKKIKIFEFQGLFNDTVDIHYPVVEMSNKSKLSCICWNSYIRNYLASTDYDGIVKLWDASTGQEFSQFAEHSERAWSVDFSRVDPTKLASGSDDRLVKIWSINERNSLCTIRNNANVCCVQFSAHSSHLLSFTSADYKTYCYDLRNVSMPWCVLAGHDRAVSYAKFLDAGTIVSASTDNTLKIWDLKKTSSNSLSRDACILTLRGHTNEKNFVGLSVADGYIACGSETNEVYAYHRSLPMPITAHKFGSIDQITGKETEDDNGQFVSSVCWRRKSNMVVAANSTGCIKLLQMV